MKFVEESSSSSKAEDENSVIAIKPFNVANIATTPTTLPTSCVAKPAQRAIVIEEPA